MADPIPIVSKATWKKLYAQARAFHKLAPWQWMEDTHIFGVQDPVSKEIGYCCVLGNAGEVFGLAYYRGEEGLNYIEALLADLVKQEEGLYEQNVLVMTFGPKGYLEKADREVIQSLNYQPPVKDRWPSFRSHLPGYYPWPLTEDETQLFTTVLERALNFVQTLRKDPQTLQRPNWHSFLVDHLRDDDTWELRWIEPKRKLGFKTKKMNFDWARLEEIKANKNEHQAVWELGMVYSPEAVMGEERPYFPRVLVMIEPQTTLVLNFSMIEGQADLGETLANFILETMEKHQTFPLQISMKRADLFNLLNSHEEKMGLKFQLMNSLPALEEFQEHFFQDFRRLRFHQDSISR